MYGNTYPGNPAPMFRQRITLQQAKEIALKQVPGQILHVDMDLEHGVLVYEIFILTPQNRLFEVEILAKTGKILKIEEENDFD
ncbi:PepSY domain-containing protein [Paenibacillus sp. 102]|uniref:PepSY domain-containing protein n=1 Tax=Paenibacillus sp. 102 TaxID=3120823 RepID=UPI0031BAE5C3